MLFKTARIWWCFFLQKFLHPQWWKPGRCPGSATEFKFSTLMKHDWKLQEMLSTHINPDKILGAFISISIWRCPNLDPSSDRFVRNNVVRTKRPCRQLTWETYFLLFTCSTSLNVVYMKTIAISALHSVLPWVLPKRTRTSPFTFVYIFPSSCQKILPEIAQVLYIDTYWMFVYFKLTLYCVVL